MKVTVCMPFIFKFVCHVIFICTLQKVRRSFEVWPGTSSFWEKMNLRNFPHYEFRWFGMRSKFMQECSVARGVESMNTNILKSSFKNVRRKIRSWGGKSEQNETELKLLNVKGEEQWRKKQNKGRRTKIKPSWSRVLLEKMTVGQTFFITYFISL